MSLVDRSQKECPYVSTYLNFHDTLSEVKNFSHEWNVQNYLFKPLQTGKNWVINHITDKIGMPLLKTIWHQLHKIVVRADQNIGDFLVDPISTNHIIFLCKIVQQNSLKIAIRQVKDDSSRNHSIKIFNYSIYSSYIDKSLISFSRDIYIVSSDLINVLEIPESLRAQINKCEEFSKTKIVKPIIDEAIKHVDTLSQSDSLVDNVKGSLGQLSLIAVKNLANTLLEEINKQAQESVITNEKKIRMKIVGKAVDVFFRVTLKSLLNMTLPCVILQLTKYAPEFAKPVVSDRVVELMPYVSISLGTIAAIELVVSNLHRYNQSYRENFNPDSCITNDIYKLMDRLTPDLKPLVEQLILDKPKEDENL